MRFFLPLFVLLIAACSPADPNLPTPEADGNIYITATPALPTPNADGIIFITPTPDPAAQAAQPTAVLPPTIAPTDVPLPAVGEQAAQVMAQADTLLDQGYYEEAVRSYQAILAQVNDPTLRGDAAFKLGQSAVREGLFQDAVDALTTLIDTLPDHPRYAQAYFLRGDAYLGLNQWQAAINDFERYLSLRPDLIDSYAHERIADAHFALGNIDSAIAAYDRALAANRLLVPQLALRERVARIYISIGRVDDAVAQYDQILSVARISSYRALIDTAAAEALVNAGQVQAGLSRAQRVFENYPETAPAYDAMQLLLENEITLNDYQRGVVNFTVGAYPAAIDAFNTFTSSNTLDAIPPNLYLLLGRAYREIGNWDAARVAFQTLIEQYPNDPLFGDALLERGRTYFLEGDIPTAIETYSAIADSYGYLNNTAAEALWRVGYLQGARLEAFEDSRQTFIRLANEYPNSEWALSGLEIAASNAVANNQTAVAENLYGRIAAIALGEDRAAAYYWVGRFALDRGDSTAANDAFAQARAAAPDTFFAQRAYDISIGREAFVPPQIYVWEFDDTTQRQQAETWLRETFAITEQGDLSVLSPSLAADPRIVRGRELWAVAAYDEAQAEFTAVLDEARNAGDALTAYRMAHMLRDLSDYYTSIVAAADVIVASGVSTLDAPPYIARMRYPAYYVELVLLQAADYGFDPLLMLALIRQESLFDANATSVANALGLAQVIPSTAQYIAGQLAWPDFQDQDLYKPHVGVAFGAYYLDEQLRLFDGNKAAALAAYNAGPGYTLDWFRLSGGDVDALVQTITFDETRRYVQRIYSHYTIYRALYGG